MNLRPYQIEARDAILRTWETNKSQMCVVATGGGKTLIAADASAKVAKAGGRILYLANRNELLKQPYAIFETQTGISPALEKANVHADRQSPIVIGSVQTLSRPSRLETWDREYFSHIFADEAHMAAAASWRRIFDHFASAKICGITATPFRADNKSLIEIFETESFRADLFHLVDGGWLVNPDNVDRLSTAISLAGVRVKRGVEGVDYDLGDAADAIAPYFRAIAQEIAANHSERRILAYLPLIASSKKFVEICVDEGINAVHIDGEDCFREHKLEAFRAGKIQLLANANLLTMGVDVIPCDTTLNLRPTRSKVLYCQIVGRSTRTVPGILDSCQNAQERLQAIANSPKPRAYILDPLWMNKPHGTRADVYGRLSKALGWKYHTAKIRTIEEARTVYLFEIGRAHV